MPSDELVFSADNGTSSSVAAPCTQSTIFATCPCVPCVWCGECTTLPGEPNLFALNVGETPPCCASPAESGDPKLSRRSGTRAWDVAASGTTAGLKPGEGEGFGDAPGAPSQAGVPAAIATLREVASASGVVSELPILHFRKRSAETEKTPFLKKWASKYPYEYPETRFFFSTRPSPTSHESRPFAPSL